MRRSFGKIGPSGFPAVLGALTVSACVSAGASQANLDATLWVQTSVEYGAVARSVYVAAARDLPILLADSSRTAALEQTGDYERLPPAVIVDVDETVLDNSPFQARLLLGGERFNRDSWAAWVHEARAQPVPGALEFVNRASDMGITVFYVTNRDADLESSTRANLAGAGFRLQPGIDDVLTRGERPAWTSDKSSRRRHVASTHRVLMLIGDDLNDFVTVDRRSPTERATLALRHVEWWGERWRMLPGPTYGSWERSLYGFDHELGDADRLERKTDHLDPAT